MLNLNPDGWSSKSKKSQDTKKIKNFIFLREEQDNNNKYPIMSRTHSSHTKNNDDPWQCYYQDPDCSPRKHHKRKHLVSNNSNNKNNEQDGVVTNNKKLHPFGSRRKSSRSSDLLASTPFSWSDTRKNLTRIHASLFDTLVASFGANVVHGSRGLSSTRRRCLDLALPPLEDKVLRRLHSQDVRCRCHGKYTDQRLSGGVSISLREKCFPGDLSYNASLGTSLSWWGLLLCQEDRLCHWQDPLRQYFTVHCCWIRYSGYDQTPSYFSLEDFGQRVSRFQLHGTRSYLAPRVCGELSKVPPTCTHDRFWLVVGFNVRDRLGLANPYPRVGPALQGRLRGVLGKAFPSQQARWRSFTQWLGTSVF